MDAAQLDLVERLRALLVNEPTVREVSMFGGRSFMVDERLLASAQQHGGLLVRIDAARSAELLGKPGASRAVMGAGRTMGLGWIDVDASVIGDDDHLAWWIGIALDCNRAAAVRTARPRAW